jgi:spermidine synthase
MVRQRWFLAGLFFTTLSTLLLEVLDTRLLSVLTWYHLSFFAVSTAMFGLAAGAVRVYVGGAQFTGENARKQLAGVSFVYALSVPVLHIVIVHVPLPLDLVSYSLSHVAVTAFLAALLLAIPFYLAGIVIGVALTRIPGRIGITYCVDLVGAATGCLLAVPLLSCSDISTAIFAAGALGVAGSLCFHAYAGSIGRLWLTAVLLPLFVLGTVWNGVEAPYAVRLIYEKGEAINRQEIVYEGWNSHSQIVLKPFQTGEPSYWGPGKHPEGLQAVTARLIIDGSAYTDVTRWNGDPRSLDWVQYDVTSAPYHLRHGGDVAVIGVGGGRDVCTALWAESRSITGIELNGILLDLHKGRLRSETRLADREEVRLVHDEARSYLTRCPDRYDLLQMSLIDSWASTSAGAFTLSENGLYTREAWAVFLNTLKPNGVFSTSRWFAPDRPSETSRLIALATAALLDRGITEPDKHIIVLTRQAVATLLVSPSPFSDVDVARAHQIAEQYEFTILAAPDVTPKDSTVAGILASHSHAELDVATRNPLFDFTAPTDERPYFFNVIKPAALLQVDLRHMDGVIHGNRLATATLLLLLGVSAVLVVLAILLPLKLAHRGQERPPQFWAAVLYFALIGTGFMMVQIPFMQRFSVYLGHPTYAVVVVLFSMILFTGIGSMLSDRLSLRPLVLLGVPCLIATFLLTAMATVSGATQATVAWPLAARCLVVLAFAAPISLLLGCCFPLGMRLLGRISDATASWMWGVNGACSVLASALGVCLSMWAGIDASLAVAALCYLVLTVPALILFRAGARKAVTHQVGIAGTREDTAQPQEARGPKSTRIRLTRPSALIHR